MFTIRRMTAADKPAMMEISSRIWEGSDYLPAVFDEWVSEREGEFAAVLAGERLVGCGKLTYLSPADAWMEGLRKDPRAAERGVAEAVARHFLARLAARGNLASIRFSAYAKNAASIIPHERLGFTLRTSFSIKALEGTREELAARDPGSPAKKDEQVQTMGDARAVMDFFERMGTFEATQGLLVDGWKAYPFSPPFLAERYIAAGRCRGILVNGEIRAALVDSLFHEPNRSIVRIVYLDSHDERGGLRLLDDLLARAVAAVPPGRAMGVEWMVPTIPRMKLWCAARGLASWEQEDDFLVFQLPLDLLPAYAMSGGGGET
jgi:ribosomal protein S18 acetylase RimI-like enzyme